MLPYNITLPTASQVPLLVSVPHCGTLFPEELENQLDPALVSFPDDTDWFVDQLYDFAPSMGIAMITAVYSRWVIDLNRDPESKPLYSDGRIITGLCPVTTFLGEPLYKDKRTEIDKTETQRRLQKYYLPYHHKLDELLMDLKLRFGRALLWDCHSIRQIVPSIQREKFPDLILGDVEQTSAAKTLTDIALTNLRSGEYSLQYNSPFKGGHITRRYGKPSEDLHALQLEMTKVNYMDDSEVNYDKGRAGRIRERLKKTLGSLSESLTS